jgi:FkbM family methyltransferase
MFKVKHFFLVFYLNLLKKVLNFLDKELARLNPDHILNQQIFLELDPRKILENQFKPGSDLSILQIGANDGVSFDDLDTFMSARNCLGVMIEPIKEYYAELVDNFSNYPNIQKLNIAIHAELDKISLHKVNKNSYYKYPNWVKGIASVYSSHLLKLGINENDIEKVEVDAFNLMTIIKQYFKGTQIDYLQIDVEGYDFEIIKMIDFAFAQPRVIKFEYVNLCTTDLSDVITTLKVNGYFLLKTSEDIYAFNIKSVLLNDK